MEDILIILCHGLIFLLVVLAVVMRYVFNDPLIWGEELIVALLTWMVFLGAAAAVRSQMHIRIDVMAPVFRMPKFIWLNTLTVIIGIVILATMTWACYEQVLQELVVDSPMMNVSKAWFVAAMPVGLTADADPCAQDMDGSGRSTSVSRRNRSADHEGRRGQMILSSLPSSFFW